jgi:O-antigen/teichoic acid export membrane protein
VARRKMTAPDQPADRLERAHHGVVQPPLTVGSQDALAEGELLDAAAIGARTARGGLLLALRSGAVQWLQLASTLLIAHFVVPASYGALTIALAALGFARYAGDLGMSNSFLALPVLDDDTFATGALVALLLALAEAGVLLLIAPLLALLLHGTGDSTAIIRVLAICIVFEALRFGPIVRLNRGLRFGVYGTVTLIETLILYVSQIGFLLVGLGIWALVLGQLARATLGTVVYLWRGGGLKMPARRVATRPLIRRALPYQGPAVLAAACGMLFPIVLALVLSAKGIGYWGWSTVLAVPISAVVAVVSAVALPSLARLRRSDPASVERASKLMIRAATVVPAVGAGVLFGFAHPIVHILFGQRWSPALVAVELNLIGIVPATLCFFLAAMLESEQRARERLVAACVAGAGGFVLALVLSKTFGLAGAAFTTAIAVPVIDLVVLASMAGIRYGRAALDGLVGFGSCALIAWLLAHFVTNLETLIACMLISAIPSCLVAWWADREAARTVLRFGVRLPPRVAAALGVRPASVAQ